MPVHCIARTSDCWLRVKLEANSVIVSVPFALKVRPIEVKNGREYFELLEGVYKGQKASVQVAPGKSYVTTSVAHRPGATVNFDLKSQTLHVNGLGPFNAFSGGGHQGYTPIAAGSYWLAIPAYPSAQTRAAYNAFTRYHNLWFRVGIETTGSRFLHAGIISDGCVTVRQFVYDPAKGKEPPAGFPDLVQGAKTAPGLLGLPLPPKPAPCVKWEELVEMLIVSRANDQAVGRLVVT